MARSTIRWTFVLGIASLAVACADAKSTPGTDPDSRSTATMVTGADGKPAIPISCDIPGRCGNYAVLKMDNMPTRGDATVVRGPGSVVVRCS